MGSTNPKCSKCGKTMQPKAIKNEEVVDALDANVWVCECGNILKLTNQNSPPPPVGSNRVGGQLGTRYAGSATS